jgi:hypothetical protein
MRLKTSMSYCAVIAVFGLLVFAGPVSAADTWIRVDPQDQVIAWEKFNANANMANFVPYSSSGSGFPLPGLKGWQNLTYNPAAPVSPVVQPSVQPSPAMGEKTIDGTPVSELFRNAMDNYRANPLKPSVVPRQNETIYSHQIPIIW